MPENDGTTLSDATAADMVAARFTGRFDGEWVSCSDSALNAGVNIVRLLQGGDGVLGRSVVAVSVWRALPRPAVTVALTCFVVLCGLVVLQDVIGGTRLCCCC